MATAECWLPGLKVRLVKGTVDSYTLPPDLWRDASRHYGVFVLLEFEGVERSGTPPTLKVDLQTTPCGTVSDYGWSTCDSVTGVTTSGFKVLKSTVTSSQHALGPIRLQLSFDAGAQAGDTFSCTVRTRILFKQEAVSALVPWVDGYYVEFAGGGASTALPMDLWADVSGYGNTYALLEFAGSGAGNLSCSFETAPLLSSSDAVWSRGSSASLTNGVAVLQMKVSDTPAPQAYLRLYISSSAAAKGTLRAQLLMKDGG